MTDALYDRQMKSSFEFFTTEYPICVPSLDPVAAHIVVDMVLALGDFISFDFLDIEPVTEYDVCLGPYKMRQLGKPRNLALDEILAELRGRYENPKNSAAWRRVLYLATQYPTLLQNYSNDTVYAWVGSEYALLGIYEYPAVRYGHLLRFVYGDPHPLLIHLTSAVLLERLGKFTDEDPSVFFIGPANELHTKITQL